MISSFQHHLARPQNQLGHKISRLLQSNQREEGRVFGTKLDKYLISGPRCVDGRLRSSVSPYSDIKKINGSDSLFSSVIRIRRLQQSVPSAKSKGLLDGVIHNTDCIYYLYPYLKNAGVVFVWAAFGTIFAYIIVPKILKNLKNYISRSVYLTGEPLMYEESIWGALEDTAACLSTFTACSQISGIVAPDIVQNPTRACWAAAVAAFTWFLHRWKTSVFRKLYEIPDIPIDHKKLRKLDNAFSLGIFIVGAFATANAGKLTL